MILIKSGTLHNGKGDILQDVDILIKDGKIKDIRKDINLEDNNVEIIDAKGKVIFPGFIDSLNVWGTIGPSWEDKDLEEHSNPVTPEMNVVYSFDHESMVYQRVFEYGVTSAGITPSNANVIGGQAAVFKTYGTHPYKMLIKEKAAMVSSITSATKKVYGVRNIMPMTKMGAFSLLKESLIEAESYNVTKENCEYNSKKEAMKMVLNKEIPLFINCNTKSDIDAISLALKEFDINLVYTGAFGANCSIGNIVNKNYGVILGDLTNAMSYPNSLVKVEDILELLENNVDVAISSCGDNIASGKESLLWNAILWHKKGIDSENVLKMITSIPAKLLGVDDRVGSIEVGKDADLVIWSNNPIETYAAVAEKVYIDGENVLDLGRNLSCW